MVAARLFAIVLALGFVSAWLDSRRGVVATVSPKVGLAPLQVNLKVFSDEPGLTCPSIRVEWAEGNTSFQESDCDPEDLPETFSFTRWSPIRYGPGDHSIRVILEQGKRRVSRDADLHVAGAGE